MEEWKDIEGWEGKYQVSNYGDIKRLERDITDSLGRTKHYTEKIFHPHKANNGYTRVSFGTERDLTHRVVAKAFIPNPLNLPEVKMDIGKISILQGPKKIIMKTEIWNGLTEKKICFMPLVQV